MTLSYLGFLLLFVSPPLLGLLALLRYRSRPLDPVARWGLGIMVVLALAYTTPWDNHLVGVGVWEYAEGSVAFRLWRAPIEEYAFVVLQSAVTALWLHHLEPFEEAVGVTSRDRLVGAVGGVLVTAAGVHWLGSTGTYYLGAILAWAGPVLALQWGFGWPYLWAARRTVAVGVAVPTLYFATADRIAIELGVWSFSPAHLTGLSVLGLPVEEGLFFLVTNLFVVQGLVLLRWVVRRWA